MEEEMDLKDKALRRLNVVLFVSAMFLMLSSGTGLYAQQETISSQYPSYELDSYFRYMPERSVEAKEGEIEIIESEAEHSYIAKFKI